MCFTMELEDTYYWYPNGKYDEFTFTLHEDDILEHNNARCQNPSLVKKCKSQGTKFAKFEAEMSR